MTKDVDDVVEVIGAFSPISAMELLRVMAWVGWDKRRTQDAVQLALERGTVTTGPRLCLVLRAESHRQ
jgi:hypothetical protein